jgi:membrane associated rhomboid family serine protease
MPQCVECRAETPRADMFGPPDELRCAKCVGKRRLSIADLPEPRDPTAPPVWTFTLVLMAVIVFVGAQLPGAERATMLWNEPTRIWDGEVWRLLTTVLPHGGFLHLFFNCYALTLLGVVTERALGPSRFFGLLVLCALGASATQFLVQPTPTVGLSGVVYGLFGFLFAIRLYRDYASVVMTESVMKQFIGWFVLCWILTYGAGWPIANFAHAGGFAVGWLTGKSILRRRAEWRIAAIAGIVVIMAAMTTYMPWNAKFRRYQELKELRRESREAAAASILETDDRIDE